MSSSCFSDTLLTFLQLYNQNSKWGSKIIEKDPFFFLWFLCFLCFLNHNQLEWKSKNKKHCHCFFISFNLFNLFQLVTICIIVLNSEQKTVDQKPLTKKTHDRNFSYVSRNVDNNIIPFTFFVYRNIVQLSVRSSFTLCFFLLSQWWRLCPKWVPMSCEHNKSNYVTSNVK